MQRIHIGANKRRDARFAYRLLIEILHPQFGKQEGQAIDLSIGGLCFTTDKRMFADSKMIVRLNLPKIKKCLEFTGRVAWIGEVEVKNEMKKQYKIGLEFVGHDAAEKRILSKFLKSIHS
jgi:Tfp pilus assembly protein PilZ